MVVLVALLGGVYLRLREAEVTGSDFLELARTFPRHNSFQYTTADSLGEEYFGQARGALGDQAVYLVLSNTRSAASKIIGIITGDRYNHISLAFDRDLGTLVSYNGGNEKRSPGLNRESLGELRVSRGSSLAVYRLTVTPAEKEKMLDQVRRINTEGSSYNLAGLFLKRSFKPNIMFCSQFVYTLLDRGGIRLFDKDSAWVKPMDFLNLNRDSRLSLLYEYPGELSRPSRTASSTWLTRRSGHRFARIAEDFRIQAPF